jgi:hypothetical protein
MPKPEWQVRVCNVKYVLDRVNHRDRFSTKMSFRSSASGAGFHTKHASNTDVVLVLLLDTNSYSYSGLTLMYVLE